MLYMGEFQAFSSNMMSLSLRHGNPFQDYISECPHHGMENCLLMQTFFHGLTNNTCETMDATAGGAFLSLTLSIASGHIPYAQIRTLWWLIKVLTWGFLLVLFHRPYSVLLYG